jgi:hypothetical protein
MTSVPTAGRAVAEPVRVRRLTDQEGQKLQQIVGLSCRVCARSPVLISQQFGQSDQRPRMTCGDRRPQHLGLADVGRTAQVSELLGEVVPRLPIVGLAVERKV